MKRPETNEQCIRSNQDGCRFCKCSECPEPCDTCTSKGKDTCYFYDASAEHRDVFGVFDSSYYYRYFGGFGS